jgi:hypothetical protein
MPPEQEPAPQRRRLPRSTVVTAGLLLAAYLVLVVTGTTISSLGVPSLREDPTSHSGTFGFARDIRSDEFTVETPLVLGLAAAGSQAADFPLSEPADLVSGVPNGGGAFADVVLFDGTLMRLAPAVPVASLFAARWWLPWLLLLLALPPWLRRVGATTPMSWLATALVAASPPPGGRHCRSARSDSRSPGACSA